MNGTILLYVDDLLITSNTKSEVNAVADTLRNKYGGVTFYVGLQHDYLGIHWDFSVPGEVTLSMDGYIKNILKKYKIMKSAKTPATDQLFNYNSESKLLSKSKQTVFHSCVMELHYLAKRIRGDILCAVSYCATRILAPNEDDEKKLDRILSYLLYTQNLKMVLRIGASVTLNAFVDASFGTYNDMKSVTGVVIMIGGTTIYVKSGKQKILTRSSTEAELVGLSDALSQIIWVREFLIHQGLSVGSANVLQDNMSTICLANKGRSTSERTRHIKIRYFFITHYIDTHEIVLKHHSTQSMIADLFTKPLHGSLFLKFRQQLLGLM